MDTDDFLKSEAVFLKYSRDMISSLFFAVVVAVQIFKKEYHENFRAAIFRGRIIIDFVFLLFWAVILFISAKDVDVFNNCKIGIVGAFMLIDIVMVVITFTVNSCFNAYTFSHSAQNDIDNH